MFTDDEKLAIGLAMDYLGPKLSMLEELAEHATSQIDAKVDDSVVLEGKDFVAMHSLMMLAVNALRKSGALNILELALIVAEHRGIKVDKNPLELAALVAARQAIEKATKE